MSKKQTPTAADSVRILDRDEYTTAVAAARAALDRFHPRPRLDHGMLEELTTAALAAVGVFEPAPVPESLVPDTCTALYLPHETDLYGPHAPDHHRNLLGQWQQCAAAPGHDDDGWHHGPNLSWRDTDPCAVPARTEARA